MHSTKKPPTNKTKLYQKTQVLTTYLIDNLFFFFFSLNWGVGWGNDLKNMQRFMQVNKTEITSIGYPLWQCHNFQYAAN